MTSRKYLFLIEAAEYLLEGKRDRIYDEPVQLYISPRRSLFHLYLSVCDPFLGAIIIPVVETAFGFNALEDERLVQNAKHDALLRAKRKFSQKDDGREKIFHSNLLALSLVLQKEVASSLDAII
eukprot:scaffold29466_cov56-Attheya_sp.AAC.1